MDSWEPSSDRIQKRYLPSAGMSMKPEKRTPSCCWGGAGPGREPQTHRWISGSWPAIGPPSWPIPRRIHTAAHRPGWASVLDSAHQPSGLAAGKAQWLQPLRARGSGRHPARGAVHQRIAQQSGQLRSGVFAGQVSERNGLCLNILEGLVGDSFRACLRRVAGDTAHRVIQGSSLIDSGWV